MKILPVIVLYKRLLSDCDSVNSLLKQNNIEDYIDCIYIHDNSPEISYQESTRIPLKIVYEHDPTNSGVSKAYNNATKYAVQHGYDWLLLLDQDTMFPKLALDIYIKGINSNPEINLFCPILKTKSGAICSPCLYKFHRGFTPKSIKLGINLLKYYSPINSCTMISVNKIISAGGYNEQAYLDFSDFQFIERFKKIEKEFFVVDFIAEQDFSNDSNVEAALIQRFKIYCNCALGCDKENFADRLQYLGMVFFRALRLFQKTRNFNFFRIFYKEYLVKR